MQTFRFFFPTPFTPVPPEEAMDQPFGAPQGVYNLMTYGLQDSGVRWGQVADHDELHAPETSPGYGGPQRYVQGTVIAGGSWQRRHSQ